MGIFLELVGGIWAIIGLGNLILMPWDTAGKGLVMAGLMFNVLLFVLPGLVVYGIGSGITTKKKQEKSPVEAGPTNFENEKSVEARLQELDALKDKGLISAKERASRRKEILSKL